MCRHKSITSSKLLPIQLVGLVVLLAGCLPAEGGDADTNAPEAVFAQFAGFVADFARQLLAAYLF